MVKIDPEKFANAVVISSPEKTTIKSKLNLYIKAVEAAEEHNKSLQKSKIKTFDLPI